MSHLLVQIRVSISILLLCLSSASNAMQIQLDEHGDESTKIKNVLSAQHLSPELDDQDGDQCAIQTISDVLPKVDRSAQRLHNLVPRKNNSLFPIRAPPSKP